MLAEYLQMNPEIEKTIADFRKENPNDEEFKVIRLAGNKNYHVFSEKYKEKSKYKTWPFAWLYKGQKINDDRGAKKLFS